MQYDHKHDEKKSQNASVADKKYCCVKCGRPKFPVFLCRCGGGGGGGSNGGSTEIPSEKETPSSSKEDTSLSKKSDQVDVSTSHDPSKNHPDESAYQHDDHELLDREMLITLLEKKLFMIEDNAGLGMLTIKCHPHLLSTHEKTVVENFVRVIKSEFDAFIKKHRIANKDCAAKIERNAQGNILSLTISFSQPKLYDQFIQHLAKKNLLPKNNVMHHAKKSIVHSKNLALEHAVFHPSPFTRKLKPN